MTVARVPIDPDQDRFPAGRFAEGQAVVVHGPRKEFITTVDLVLGDGEGGEETSFGRVTGLELARSG
jgi:hypothetical protein